MKTSNNTVQALVEATRQLARVTDLLAQELQLQEEKAPPEWLPTEQAWEKLSLPSAEALRRKRRASYFQIGTHYRLANHNPNANQKRYEFHIERCKQRLDDPPRNWAKSAHR